MCHCCSVTGHWALVSFNTDSANDTGVVECNNKQGMMLECNNDGTIALGLIPGTGGGKQGGNKSCLTVINELSADITVAFTAKVMLQLSQLLCWAY